MNNQQEVLGKDLDMCMLFSEFYISEDLTENEQVSRTVEINREIFSKFSNN